MTIRWVFGGGTGAGSIGSAQGTIAEVEIVGEDIEEDDEEDEGAGEFGVERHVRIIDVVGWKMITCSGPSCHS